MAWFSALWQEEIVIFVEVVDRQSFYLIKTYLPLIMCTISQVILPVRLQQVVSFKHRF